jgi:acyl carrier protein
MTQEPAEFVMEFISQYGDLPGENLQEKLKADFVQSGLLDSFGLFSLVGEIEERFDIQLSADDLADPGFKTAGGLASIISRHLSSR